MSLARWRFSNRANPAETIEVTDFESAKMLIRLLKESGKQEQWVLHEEAAPRAIPPRPRMDTTPEPASSDMPPPIFATARKNGKRRHERYKVEFRVILVSGGKIFRSFSNDVSVGGMMLKQKVPAAMLDQVCTVYIGSRNGPENIELKCRIISDSSNPCRIAFVDCDVPGLKRLEAWMLSARNQASGATQAA